VRVFYLDAGLTGDVGHHANHCRYIVGELRARSLDVQVFAFVGILPVLQAELSAKPHFRNYSYWLADDDPISEWRNGFPAVAASIEEDLCGLPEAEACDLIFVAAASPAQVLAVAEWRDRLPAARRPAIVFELITSDLQLTRTPDRLRVEIPDPREKIRPTLFRFVAQRLRKYDGSRLHFVTYSATYAKLFSLLLETPVETVPLPYPAVTTLRNRAGAHPVNLSVLGHQRLEKGYARLPEILALLLRRVPPNSRCRDLQVFVQATALHDPSGAPDGASEAPETDTALRALAANDTRLTVDERAAGKTRWPQLLDRADLVLCASAAGDHLAAISAVAAEAIANGIPIVAPADSEVARLLSNLGCGGALYERFEPAAIVSAIERALDDFDDRATRAYHGALAWPKSHGPAQLVDALLRLAGGSGSARWRGVGRGVRLLRAGMRRRRWASGSSLSARERSAAIAALIWRRPVRM
jgi:glycosyltransferase involved in cell wall biosynthesis